MGIKWLVGVFSALPLLCLFQYYHSLLLSSFSIAESSVGKQTYNMAGSKRRRQVGEMDKFLVGHLLKKKLTGEMEAHGAIPELDIYKWEAEQLFILYDGNLI